MAVTRRMPAEWEPHRATWLAWPHCEDDWPGKFAAIPWVISEMVRLLSVGETVEILCHNEAVFRGAKECLRRAGLNEGYRLHLVSSDRGWMRDIAPTMALENGKPRWVGWNFNGWAKYDNHLLDAGVAARVAELSGMPFEPATCEDGTPFVLEGGAIDVNGEGVLLCTEECLLSDVQQRNPGLGAVEYEALFAKYLGIEQTLWLAGSCEGDDTHGHIDDVARWIAPRTVSLAVESDPAKPNYEMSQENLARLSEFRFFDGGAIDVVTLPFPEPVVFDGDLLPASYANFYIGNEVVLVPGFNDVQDRVAVETLAPYFPQRRVMSVASRDLVLGLGSFHCLTQQECLAL